MAVLDQVAKRDVDMIFVGDSITHFFEKEDGKAVWDKYYAPRKAVNLGFSGDKTQNVLWRLQNGEIECISPKLAVVLIGTNNCIENNSKEIADGVIAICQELRNELPQTKILLLAIFPRADFQHKIKPEANAEASRLFSEIADNKWIYFMDINNKFLNKDGTLLKDIFPDNLHPNAQGYEIWAQAMEPTISELMGK